MSSGQSSVDITGKPASLSGATATVDQVVDALSEFGYVIVDRFIDSSQVAAIRGDLLRELAHTPEGRNAFEGAHTRRVYALFAKTRKLDSLATHPLVLGVAERILKHYQLSAPTGIQILPGERAQILHYDDAIYPVPRPHSEIVLNTMWALDDFTKDNGATQVVPKSHRWTTETPGPNAETLCAVMSAGSVMFYVGSLWHGGGANTTERPRLGVVIEFAASWVRPQENHLLAVPRDVVRGLDDKLQELLGYNIYPPFVGYVDGRHPKRFLSE